MANLVAEQEMFFNSFEPKMVNRFIMFMDGVPSFMVKGVARPTLTQNAKELPHINVVRYVKGRTTWGTMQFTLYDPIVPSGAQAVMEWVRLHHESVTGRDGYADFYKKDLILNMLGPVGDKVEEWLIKGAQITEASFNDANWDSDDVLEITLTIQPDFCILNF
ncbi:hypothetical protein LCGC14_1075210 [marine sediment metagenome]|uniref:Tail tube protein n=1 Tax=marine sediment metagenome TaxID=412755 RepID=A0A0F9MGU0_9ZZZZ